MSKYPATTGSGGIQHTVIGGVCTPPHSVLPVSHVAVFAAYSHEGNQRLLRRAIWTEVVDHARKRSEAPRAYAQTLPSWTWYAEAGMAPGQG